MSTNGYNTSMAVKMLRERSLYPLVAALLVAALAATVWALVFRERANKRLLLEFEAHKTITALTELVRIGSLSTEDTGNVLSFGLYDEEGNPLYRYGDAPVGLEAPYPGFLPEHFSIGTDTLTLARALGGDLPGRRMMGMLNAPRPRRPLGMEPVPFFAYLEYGLGQYRAGQFFLILAAALATLALGALYAAIVRLYARFAAYREREAKNRELVELGEAARTIAHEIKNPLGVIRIQCGVLRKGAQEPALEGISIIEDEVIRLAGMTDRIRAFLKSSPPTADRLSVKEFLEGIAVRYAGELDSVIDLDEKSCVLADAGGLREALDNLVSNALEAQTKTGGVQAPELHASIVRKRLHISVLDRGTGIAPEARRRLFEPFFTTKERGTGLGLALARKAVEADGGTLTHADRPQGGSIFTINLPLAPDNDRKTQ